MKRIAVLLFPLLLIACQDTQDPLAPASTNLAPLLDRAPSEIIPGHYIVVLKDDVSDVRGAVGGLSRAAGASVRFTYSAGLKGFAGHIPAAGLARVRRDPRVAYVEPDGVVRVVAQSLPWGINRINADASSTTAGNGSGAVGNVNVYIIDTGVDASHGDLNVVKHVDFTSGLNKDCNGHGTHVAGTVAARDNGFAVVGVAPGAPITGVKVLDCGGSGSISGVIRGVDWVTANAKRPAIANMSLEGGASRSLDDAVKRSADSGVFYAVAAGNAGANACSYSPARAGTHRGITTVAATYKSNGEISWSNYGTCVDIWAPGANILSTRMGGGKTTMSGTSMASPHVAGTGALYLSSHKAASAAAVERALKNNARSTGTFSKDGRSIRLVRAGRF